MREEEVAAKLGKLILEYAKTLRELAKLVCEMDEDPDFRTAAFFALLGYDEIDVESEQYIKTKEWIEKVKKDSTAILLDENKNAIAEIPVRDLLTSLNDKENVHTIIFNGIITQRLIDIVSEKGVKYLIGARKSNVVRRPIDLKIITFAE